MKKIKFSLAHGYDPTHGYVEEIQKPIPAQKMIPRWWHEGESFLNNKTYRLSISKKELRGAGMKSCIPFLDALTSGYLILFWDNIEIYYNKNNVVKFRRVEKDHNDNWVEARQHETSSIDERKGDIGYTMPRPHGFAFNHFAWACPWGVGLPKGWSALITHPLNREDLPFHTTSGIVDSDLFKSNGRIPFFIQDEWTGVIEKGTPIAQVIPIKRNTWISTYQEIDSKDKFLADQTRKVQYGYYRSKVWKKKKYLQENDKEE